MAVDAEAAAAKFNEAAQAVEVIRQTFESQKATIANHAQRLDAIDLAKIEKASADGQAAMEFLQGQEGIKRFESMYGEVKERNELLEDLKKRLADADERCKAVELALATGQHKGGIGGKMIVSDYAKSLNNQLRAPKGRSMLDDGVIAQEIRATIAYHHPHLDEVERDKIFRDETKTLISGSGPDGGYWVPVDRQARILERIYETSPMRQIGADVITTSSNEVEMVIDDGEIAVTWGNETTAWPTTATPQIGVLKIPVNDQYAMLRATNNMLADSSIDVLGRLMNKASRDFTRSENRAFVVGTGADMPVGFLTYATATDPDVYQRNTLGRFDIAGAAANITADGLIELQGLLKDAFQPNAKWLMRRSTWTKVMQLKDGEDQYLLRFGDMLATGVAPVLLGKSVFFADDMPVLATDSQSVAYGDFQAGYQIVDRMGMTVLVDPYTPANASVLYKLRRRVGGRVVGFDAIKILLSGT